MGGFAGTMDNELIVNTPRDKRGEIHCRIAAYEAPIQHASFRWRRQHEWPEWALAVLCSFVPISAFASTDA